MAQVQLGVIEARFADMIWEREPVRSSELVKLAAEVFQWKRTTTHTVLKRLCDKGLFENNKGTVTCRITREQFILCRAGNSWRILLPVRCLLLWPLLRRKSADARRGSGDQTDH